MVFRQKINVWHDTLCKQKNTSIIISKSPEEINKHNPKQILNTGEIPSVPTSFKGSLTLETAIALPIFLFAVVGLMMLVEAIRFSGNMQASLHQSARNMANHSYAYAYMPGSGGAGGEAVGRIISVTAGKSMTLDDLGRDYADDSPVENGSDGISFIHSSLMGSDQMIDLSAVYKIRTDIPFLGSPTFKVADRARIRAFTGYDNTKGHEDTETDEEMVYVTDNGGVYHRDRGCRHLDLTIRETTLESIGTERNAGGGRYYPCEHCGKRKSSRGDKLYIAEDGDRWHTSVTCPGLKRTISIVPLSETGLPPCVDCGM